jgi:hypothetical protein
MIDFEISFTGIKQITYTAPTCMVDIDFQITGPHSRIDLVQVYAVNTADAAPNGLGDVVDSVDLIINQFQYTSVPKLPAGSAFTIALCPRSKTDGQLDDLTEGEEYWETYCIFQSFTTVLNLGPEDPQVSVVSIQPATLNKPNQINIAWSSYSYTDGQVLWGPVNNSSENNYQFQATDVGNEPSYSGTYTATIPSALRGHILSFTVQVRNQLTDATKWYPTTIGVVSARNYHSARQFLQASDVQFPTGVSRFLNGSHSLRALMQI